MMANLPKIDILRKKRFVVDVDRMRLVDVGKPIIGTGIGVAHEVGSLTSGGALATLNRSAASSLNRNRNRNRNRSDAARLTEGSDPVGSILAPWRERALLHQLRPLWINLPVDPPPAPEQLRRDCIELLKKQYRLRQAEEATRRDDIIRESELELSGYLRPLRIEGVAGFDETVSLFLIVLDLCEEIGMCYKERFGVARPNQVEPRIRPFLAVPSHNSYPSNHSFQSFSVAFVFSRVLPEHPGSIELFRSARRIAENREWAGIHYPSDTKCGHDLARMLLPVLEIVCEKPMLAAQREWLN